MKRKLFNWVLNGKVRNLSLETYAGFEIINNRHGFLSI